MIRLVQLQDSSTRRIGFVDEPRIHLLDGFQSTYALASAAIASGTKLSDLIRRYVTVQTVEYDAVYEGRSTWRLLVPLDHPIEPARCMVSGTGLTHLGSARDRQAMHGAEIREMTDSMKMFQLGVDGGKPPEGQIGVAPEWFYKGNGTILRGHGEPLIVPTYAEDGGEEAEIAGLYLIGPDGRPHRVGMAIGNEFSDHVFEKKNYLNLAGSKLRTCAIGPELVIDAKFDSVAGESKVERNGQTIWSKAVRTGEAEMCHSVANIEHHHFKFDAHRRPGDVHVHYYGAHSLSFGDGVRCEDGDMMTIRFDGFGRCLKNPLQRGSQKRAPICAIPLT